MNYFLTLTLIGFSLLSCTKDNEDEFIGDLTSSFSETSPRSTSDQGLISTFQNDYDEYIISSDQDDGVKFYIIIKPDFDGFSSDLFVGTIMKTQYSLEIFNSDENKFYEFSTESNTEKIPAIGIGTFSSTEDISTHIFKKEYTFNQSIYLDRCNRNDEPIDHDLLATLGGW